MDLYDSDGSEGEPMFEVAGVETPLGLGDKESSGLLEPPSLPVPLVPLLPVSKVCWPKSGRSGSGVADVGDALMVVKKGGRGDSGCQVLDIRPSAWRPT